jgi:hypothetical protein
MAIVGKSGLANLKHVLVNNGTVMNIFFAVFFGAT